MDGGRRLQFAIFNQGKHLKLNRAIIQKRKKIKRPFTLIEVFICLALIALCGSVFSIQGKKLWQRHQCLQDIDRLTDELILTRHLSQTLRADLTLRLKPHSVGTIIERASDEPYFLKKSASLLKPILLRHIKIAEPIVVQFYKGQWESNIKTIQTDSTIIFLDQSNFAGKNMQIN